MYSLTELQTKKTNINGASLGTFKSAFDGQLIELIALFRGNTKIGDDFIQLSVLPLNGQIDTKSKGRYSICGNCPHHLINSCYAYDQGLFVMNREYKKGNYKPMAINDFKAIAKTKKIRFGRFGDLSLIPYEVVKDLADNCAGFTGYTNQWRSKHYDPRFNNIFMLSTLGNKDSLKAFQMYPDARQFKVIASDTMAINDNKTFMNCATDNGFKCSECMLCNGSSNTETINITIQAHGINYKTKNIKKVVKK